ncbi:MAG: type IV pilus secretin PilQ [Deltaproteobacteria bacterium]|nr:type IV pilus secretin PilQ [Deltaproteobacteria bacterium]
MSQSIRRPSAWKTVWGVALGAALAACAAPQPRTSAEPPAPAAPAAEAQRVRITGLSISPQDTGDRIHLEADGTPTHRLSVSDAPPQVSLRLDGVTLEGVAPRVDVGDGVIETLEARALPEGAAEITVRPTGPVEAVAEPVPGGLDLVVRLRATESRAATPSGGEMRQGVVEPLAGDRGLRFRFGKVPANLAAFLLSDGRRLVIDAEGVSLPSAQVTKDLEGPVVRVRLGRQEGRVRAVVEATDPSVLKGYRLEKVPEGFVLKLGESAEAPKPEPKAAPAPPAQKTEETRPAAPEARWEGLAGGGRVSDLGFRQDAEWSRIELAFTKPAPHRVVEAGPERIVVDIPATTLPKRFRRALDTSAFPGAVNLVAAYPRGNDTRVVVDLRKPAPFRIERDETHLTILVAGGSAAPPETGVAAVRREEDQIVLVEGAPAGTEEAPAAEEAGGPVYTGRRLSMDFVDADIRNVLRLIGEVSGLNLVAGDDVQGKVTVRLVDVPWDQALDVILKTRGLDKVREGNVIRIAPAERLAQERARRLEQEKAEKEQAPLVTDIVAVNYASAQELSDKVKAVLSDRGSVSVDERTNSILIKDVAERLEEARELVRRLDTQTPQVLIEARIVEVSSTFAKDLGIQWGGRFEASPRTGAATDWAFPHSIGISGDTGVGNFAVNFPSAGGAGGPGGALALTLGHVNDVFSLDLRLSAIETSGKGRVISSPRVTTLDNKTAEISQGVEIPFTTATEEKIETQSIEYKLRLNVTPHVTADRSIIMKIDLSKEDPSATFQAVDSRTPGKETRAATTEVLVKDGETTVIGGIITNRQSNVESGIPWLSKLPFVGWMFKSKNNRMDKTELIIFITPKIVNPPALETAAQNP